MSMSVIIILLFTVMLVGHIIFSSVVAWKFMLRKALLALIPVSTLTTLIWGTLFWIFFFESIISYVPSRQEPSWVPVFELTFGLPRYLGWICAYLPSLPGISRSTSCIIYVILLASYAIGLVPFALLTLLKRVKRQ